MTQILDPIQHAKGAYERGYVVEALQVLHGYIELQSRELVMLNRAEAGPHEDFDLASDSMFEIPLNIATKVLFIQGILSKAERDNIIRFSGIRNKVIHRLYTDNSAMPEGPNLDELFELGVELIGSLEKRIHERMESDA